MPEAVTPLSGLKGAFARFTAWARTLKPVRVFLLYTERRGPMLADSVTYRTLFSVFAGVLLGFSIAGLWLAGNPAAWQALIDAVDAAIPGIVGDGGIVDPTDIHVPVGLTVAGVVSLAALIGAAIGAIGSLRVALLVLAGKERDDIFWLWGMLRNLALAIGLGGALGASAAATYVAVGGVGVVNRWLGLSETDAAAIILTRGVSLLVVFVLDAVVIAALFLSLSGTRPSAQALWSGAALGAIGLTVLQQLSSLFVGGAASNPLLASFAALIALLLWFNLSAQVILLASAYIITGVEDGRTRT